MELTLIKRGAAAVCLAVLAGCDQAGQVFDQAREALDPGPRPVLEKYFDALRTGNLAEPYTYVSAQDRDAKSLEAYKAERAENPFAELVQKQSVYEVQDIQEQEAKAIATLKVTRPDMTGVARDVMGAALAAAFKGENTDEIREKLAAKYANETLPTTTSTETIELVKDPEGWRVYLDWTTEVKIMQAMLEARLLRSANNLQAALEKYDEVLALKSDMVEAKEQRQAVANEIAEQKREKAELARKQAYVDKVKLYDLEARYYETYSGNVPGVKFKLKNTGDQTLRRVEVTVYFKDAKGQVIHEETYHPVLVTKYSISNDPPLKPNYIWQLERGKFYQAKSVPDEWKAGSVSARITDIEFE